MLKTDKILFSFKKDYNNMVLFNQYVGGILAHMNEFTTRNWI